MSAAMRLAGYSPSDADDLRKAISKKKAESMAKHREKFIKGASEQGIGAGNWRKRFSRIGKILLGMALINPTPPIMA